MGVLLIFFKVIVCVFFVVCVGVFVILFLLDVLLGFLFMMGVFVILIWGIMFKMCCFSWFFRLFIIDIMIMSVINFSVILVIENWLINEIKLVWFVLLDLV